MTSERLLSAADELRLARRVERGDATAKDELVVCNLGLVYAFARRYQRRGVPFEDLVQEGTLGLVRAVERFDHRRGVRLSTYAAWWIRRSMADALNGARAIRIPAPARRQMAMIREADTELRRRGAGAPTTEAIAQRAGVSVGMVRVLGAVPRITASLDETVGDDTTPLSELIADAEQPEVSRCAEERETADHVRSMVRLLPQRQREVVVRRYGLGGAEPESHDRIGARLGVGEERSRQIERQALRWLREMVNTTLVAA